MATTSEPPAARAGADGVLEWTVWPARESRLLSAAVALAILALSALVVLSYQSVWYGVMLLVALVAATASHYLPTTYRLDDEGVALRTPITTVCRPWSAFAAYFSDTGGLFLSPGSRLTWLTQRRGLYLRCPDRLAEVTAHVRRFVEAGSEPERR